ncbi:MAG: flagellar hook-basal body complex protein FliE [Sulfobacillus sp.]
MTPISLRLLNPIQLSTSGTTGPTQGSSFSQLMASAVNAVGNSQQQANAAIQQAMSGQGTVTGAMVAMAEAQSTLDVADAVNNNVISAYQTIMNMPLS